MDSHFRLHVIKRTDFIPSGYSLMELLVWITIGLTVMADFENQLTAYFTVTFTALQFFYVIALLRDIDDPCVAGRGWRGGLGWLARAQQSGHARAPASRLLPPPPQL